MGSSLPGAASRRQNTVIHPSELRQQGNKSTRQHQVQAGSSAWWGPEIHAAFGDFSQFQGAVEMIVFAEIWGETKAACLGVGVCVCAPMKTFSHMHLTPWCCSSWVMRDQFGFFKNIDVYILGRRLYWYISTTIGANYILVNYRTTRHFRVVYLVDGCVWMVCIFISKEVKHPKECVPVLFDLLVSVVVNPRGCPEPIMLLAGLPSKRGLNNSNRNMPFLFLRKIKWLSKE